MSVDEIVETVTSSTALTFGTGAAAGAIVAGTITILIISVTSRGRKRRTRKLTRDLRDARDELKFANERIKVLKQTLYRQEKELEQEKARARANAARHARPTVDDRVPKPVEPQGFDDLDETVVIPNVSKKSDAPKTQKVEEGERSSYEWPVDKTAVMDVPVVETPASKEDTASSVKTMLDDRISFDSLEVEQDEASEVLTGILETDDSSSAIEDEYAVLDEAYDVAARVEEDMPTGRNVRLVLDERLTPDAFTGIGTYRRAAVRATDIPAFLSRRRARQYDPDVRASLIDQRVPRFDESLYPDALRHVHDEVDIFDTAMRAMEDTLQHTAALGIEEEEDVVYLHPEDRPEIVDPAAYIDYLMKDELEKTNGTGLPTSHARFSKAQSFADLTGSKKRGKYSPRHMRVAS